MSTATPDKYPNQTSDFRNITLIIYALYTAGVAIGILLLPAIGLNYYYRSKVKGTLSESHMDWQIKTFWYFLAFFLIGIFTAYFYFGYVIIFAGALFLSVRSIWGAIRLYQSQPM